MRTIFLVLILQFFYCVSMAQTNDPGINRFLRSYELIRLGYTDRTFDGLTFQEKLEGYKAAHQGPVYEGYSRSYELAYTRLAEASALGVSDSHYFELTKYIHGLEASSEEKQILKMHLKIWKATQGGMKDLSFSEFKALQEKIRGLNIPEHERNRLELQLFPQKMQNDLGLAYIKKEKFFVLKHGKEAIYRYPGELMHFMLANMLVMYGTCFGVESSVSFYKASVKDPVCIQNMMELFTDPVFYGGFLAFMAANGYLYHPALNALSAISEYRNNRSTSKNRRPMKLSTAQMWAGQISMAFGFFADQTFQRLVENENMKKCTKAVIKSISSGKPALNQEQIENDAGVVEVNHLNDKDQFCVKAYRELVTSSMTRDSMTSGVLGLGLSAYINGLVTPKALSGIGYLVNWTGQKTGQAATSLVVSKSTPVFIKAGAAGLLQVGYRVAPVINGIGKFAARTTNLAVFLALSQALTQVIDPFIKTITGTIDFKNDVKSTTEALKKYNNDEFYSDTKCPWDYDGGEVLLATGLCSRVPGVAELRELHSYQRAWRQSKILGTFNMAYHNWQTKWNNFHTLYKSTQEVWQEIAKLREFDQTGKIDSVETAISEESANIEQNFAAYSEATGVEIGEVKEQVKELFEDKDMPTPSPEIGYLRFLYGMNQYRRQEYEELLVVEPLNFRDIESDDPERVNNVIFFERMDDIYQAIELAKTEAVRRLDPAEQQAYWLIKEKLEKLTPSSTMSEARINRYQRKFDELEQKVELELNSIWIESSGLNTWLGLPEDPRDFGKSPVAPEERWSFTRAVRVFMEQYNVLKDLDAPALHDFEGADIELSYALIALQKFSRIHPLVNSKLKMQEALANFDPVHPYGRTLHSIQNSFASLAGYDFEVEGQAHIGIIPDKGKPFTTEDDVERPEKFWQKGWYHHPEPFIGSSDLYEYVMFSGLCKREARHNWTPETALISGAVDTVYSLVFPDKEGWSLEFNLPSMTDHDFCEKVVDFHRWGNQMGYSAKNSIFRAKQEKWGEFDAFGLAEVGIYDDRMPEFMSREDHYIDWWNSQILPKIVPEVAAQKNGYFEMIDTYLSPEYDNHTRGDLEMAVAGIQSNQTWDRFSPSPITDWFYYAYRDYVVHTYSSWFSDYYEHSNFKQSENLMVAYANEFGILTNYLFVMIRPIAEKAIFDSAADAAAAQEEAAGTDARPPLAAAQNGETPSDETLPKTIPLGPMGGIELSDRNYVELSPENTTGLAESGTSIFVPDEIVRSASDFVVETLADSIKNIKYNFVNLLLTWDKVDSGDTYGETLKLLRASLGAIAKIAVEDERPLARVKALSKRRDAMILYESKDEYEPAGSPKALKALKMKPLYVVIDELDNILEEIELLRKQKFAESFNFDEILKDYKELKLPEPE